MVCIEEHDSHAEGDDDAASSSSSCAESVHGDGEAHTPRQHMQGGPWLPEQAGAPAEGAHLDSISCRDGQQAQMSRSLPSHLISSGRDGREGAGGSGRGAGMRGVPPPPPPAARRGEREARMTSWDILRPQRSQLEREHKGGRECIKVSG